MRDIRRRIRTMEKKLNISNDRAEPVGIVIHLAGSDGVERTLPEKIEEWITYKEHQKSDSSAVMILRSSDEVKARERLKAEKRQDNEYKETN